MLKITNPTKQDVSFVYLGAKHTVEAESSVNKPEGVAEAWKKIHQFLLVEPMSAPVKRDDKDDEQEVKAPAKPRGKKAEVPVVPPVEEEKLEEADEDEKLEEDQPDEEAEDTL